MYEVIVAQKLEVELNNSFFGKKGDEVLGQTKILKLVKNELKIYYKVCHKEIK